MDGLVIGGFRLSVRLGDGGMGEVYAATQTRWGHPVAVKLARSALTGRDGTRRAFQAEVRAIAALDHPHVVRIHDQGVVGPEEAAQTGGALHEGVPWLVMERAAGTLGPPDGWDALRRALLELLDGLAAAHAIGILHLDIKPSNVLVRDDGSHALADFGIVLLRGALGHDPGSVTWGSPSYMAPERFDGRPERLVEATDLYAVGCLAYELATGAQPFPCSSWDRAAIAHRSHPVPPIRPRIPVPAGFSTWIRTLLAKRPGERFETAVDARHALACLGDPDPTAIIEARPAAEPTLTVTTLGEAVPVEALLVASVAPSPAPTPTAWRLPDRARRLEGVGLGLLGLLAVPFVGRERERDALWEELAAADRGAGPRLVVLTGPAGAGRSRLGEAFATAAAGSCAILRVAGREASPLSSAVRTFAGIPGSLDERRIREAVALRLQRPVDAPAVGAVAAALLGTGAPADALLAIAEVVAHRRPVVLWVDDVLHDEALLDAVTVALRRGPSRLLVVVSASDQARASAPDGRLDALTGTRVAVEPLDPATARELLASWVGLGPELVADLAERCEGDVGLALAVVREGVRSRRLAPGARGLRAVDDAPLPFPEPLVARWRAHLPPRDEQALWVVLERAAVMGANVSRARLERAVEDASTCAAVQSLVVDRGLGVATADGWKWATPAVRACILAGAGDRLVAHHLACAETYAEGEDSWARATHLLHAGRVREAFDGLFDACSDVIAEGRMAEAARKLRLLEEAMHRAGIGEDDPAWGELYRGWAMLGPTHQGYDACRAYGERAVALARRHPEDPDWRLVWLNAAGGLAWLATVQLLPRIARTWLDEESKILRQDGRRSPSHLDRVGWYALAAGDAALAMRAFSDAVELATELGVRHIRYVSDASLGVAMRHAGHPDAVAHLERAGRAMLDAGYLSARADLAAALGDAERHRGRYEQAEAHYEEALRAMAEGEARADNGFRVGYALLLRDTGRLARAGAELETCRRLLGDDGPSWAAVVDLHLAAVASAQSADPEPLLRVDAAADALLESGFTDPDVLASARAVSDAMKRLALRTARIDALVAAQARALRR